MQTLEIFVGGILEVQREPFSSLTAHPVPTNRCPQAHN